MYRNAGITGKQGTVVRRKPRFNPILGTFGAAGPATSLITGENFGAPPPYVAKVTPPKKRKRRNRASYQHDEQSKPQGHQPLPSGIECAWCTRKAKIAINAAPYRSDGRRSIFVCSPECATKAIGAHRRNSAILSLADAPAPAPVPPNHGPNAAPRSSITHPHRGSPATRSPRRTSEHGSATAG